MSADTITDLRRRFNFFLDNAGGWVGHNAESAIALARAERYAEQHGWTFKWEYDDIAEPTEGCRTCDHLTHCRTDRDGQRCIHVQVLHEHGPMHGCILKDEHGTTLGSLWSIDTDPCPHGGGVVMGYGRVVQAELALEAMNDIERRQHEDRDAERYMAL